MGFEVGRQSSATCSVTRASSCVEMFFMSSHQGDTPRLELERELGFLDPLIEEQNQIADHILGTAARRHGEPFDPTKSPVWQRGWLGLTVWQEDGRSSVS